MNGVTFFTRGSKYASVEVLFSSIEKAKEFSDKTLKTAEMVLIPSYIGPS